LAFKILRNWLRGIISDNDSLDMPGDSLQACRNYIIKPGMLEHRPAAKKVLSSGLTALAEFNEFKVFTGSSTSRFILLRDGNGIERYDLSGSPVSYNAASFGEVAVSVMSGVDVTASTVFAQSGVAPKFYTANQNIRITRVGDNDSTADGFETLFYGFINRGFFNGLWTFNDWFFDIARLIPPAVYDGSGNNINTAYFFSQGGSGKIAGKYFARLTYEYDGYQHSYHKDPTHINGEYDELTAVAPEYLTLTVNDPTATLAQSFRYPLISKRLTAIHFYMAYSPDTNDDQPRTAFYKVARVGLDDSTWALDYTLDTGLNTSQDIDGSTDPVTFTVSSAVTNQMYVGEFIKIDSEVLEVTVVNGASVTASRAAQGSSIAAHLQPKDIYLGRPKAQVRIKLSSGGSSADFPANHESYNVNDVIYSFEEEYYLTLNALPGISEGFDVKSYSDGIWVNGRHFIIRPNINKTRLRKVVGVNDYTKEIELPYDPRQTVLFSKLNQPDAFDFMLDFIDLSTEEGDPIVAEAEIAGDLVVLKSYNMFTISLNNTSRALDWGITHHFQKVGCISRNSVAKGNGVLFFAGEDNIYAYDGKAAVPITHNKIREAYVAELANVTDYEDMWGIFDPHRNRYMLYIPDNDEYVWIYEQGTQAWSQYDYADGSNKYDIKNLQVGAALELFAANDDGDAILQLETTGGAEAAQTKTLRTQWVALTENTYAEERLNFIRLDMNLAGGTYNIQIYANGNTTTPVWTATSQTAKAGRDVHYHEVSEVARLFMLQLQVTTATAKVYGIEFNEIRLEDQQ
jgi:hypothetical protein